MTSSWREEFTAFRKPDGWTVDLEVSDEDADSPFDWGYRPQDVKAVIEATKLRDLFDELTARHQIEIDERFEDLFDEIDVQEVTAFCDPHLDPEEKEAETEEHRQQFYGEYLVPGVYCDVTGRDWDLLRVEYGPAGWKGTLHCDGRHDDLNETYSENAPSFRDAAEAICAGRSIDPRELFERFLAENPDLRALIEREAKSGDEETA